MNHYALWTVLATCIALSLAVRPPSRGGSTDRATESTQTVTTRVRDLETRQTQLKRKVTDLTAQRDTLERRLSYVEGRLATQDEYETLAELLRASELKNQELTKMLSNYERFFGTLYAETPEAFDPTLGVDKRLSSLNSYLGNKEAELLALRPDPPTVIDNSTVDEELLGNALYNIERQRSRLDQKLRRLEENIERMASSVPDHAIDDIREGLQNEDTFDGPATGGRSPDRSQSGPRANVNICDPCRRRRSIDGSSSLADTSTQDDEFDDRLERLEALVLLHLLPLINKTIAEQNSSSRTTNGDSASVLTNLTQLEELEAVIYELRARQDSKKVAFSVSRTTPLLGTNNPLLVEFDHVILNKGGDYIEENSTFVCSVPGYYVVTFTVRSFDGYVLGVHLMKNEDHVTGVFMDAHSRNVMGSQTVLVHLDVGDRLWIRHPPSTRFAIHSDQYKYTTFSAFLLYKGN